MERPQLALKYSVDTNALAYRLGISLHQTSLEGERRTNGYWFRTLVPAKQEPLSSQTRVPRGCLSPQNFPALSCIQNVYGTHRSRRDALATYHSKTILPLCEMEHTPSRI